MDGRRRQINDDHDTTASTTTTTRPQSQQFTRRPLDALHHERVTRDPLKSCLSSTSSCRVSNNFIKSGAKTKRVDETRSSIVTNRQRATDALHDEIVAYTASVQSTVKQLAVPIEETIANVRRSVLSLWPEAKVETFGSYATGLWLPDSDVDLVVILSPASCCSQSEDAKQTTTEQLRELATLLQTKHWVASLVVLDTAKVPVLKVLSATTSVPIDITFQSAATHSGLLARDLIKRYTAKIPELYPLAIVFKQLLRERDLNDAYTGGLSSYSLVLMLIHFSQLWRNGDSCFQAAAVYASGALPPLPSTLVASSQTMKHGRRIQSDLTSVSQRTAEETKFNGVEATSVPLPAPASSYATVVARAKTQQTLDGASQEPATKPRFSYAAVAAGIVKASENKKPAGPPCSYAAAVAASAALPSAASNGKNPTTATKQVQDTHSLDAVSVSSSNADTEDSSSSCSHSSLMDSDDESAKVLSHLPPASLGEHTMMVLEFFGLIFDYSKNGLSVRDGGYIYRLAESHRSQVGKPALVIEDPIHPDRNVSASSFAFFKVVALFEDSFYAVKYFRASKFTPSVLRCLLRTAGQTNISHSNAGS
uniref:Polymerase nucleotidyl transferase domain-containing protein n=1 Tax=Hyaloperonospora arabidopsidis (strain Emoy2) TaxID=559515 RepID=M4BA68_HYAAE